ncbi:hypothetical protein OU994_20085 [Pseudoduganella sp. SL102]|uniref:hypothetical protein n=1 Tax=Pseudoduganella sp. SL102 TaxID=2995154 RepID=UPI00248B3791|nr:hypothetical protein [Pseudoduganella sp. SL102]WBS00608.1 hypothetical protein OU994_20085 [Pseudoduganella sp. SL102]
MSRKRTHSTSLFTALSRASASPLLTAVLAIIPVGVALLAGAAMPFHAPGHAAPVQDPGHPLWETLAVPLACGIIILALAILVRATAAATTTAAATGRATGPAIQRSSNR